MKSMTSTVNEASGSRKHYLDNIRWVTVVIVVLYHVIYMYNGQITGGVVGKITDLPVQYYDLFQYAVYPWFMMLLFMVSGISSRLYLERHTDREFLKSRTTKLLVPGTIGLLAFQFLQGYVNASIAGGYGSLSELPLPIRYLILAVSGIGVLWYIQVLWVNSLVLFLLRKVEKDRLWNLCGKLRDGSAMIAIPALCVLTFGAARILNTPVISVYRFGLYLFTFLIGYYVLSHEAVVEALQKWFPVFAAAAVVLGIFFCITYFGENYADQPVNRTLLFVAFGYFTSMAILGGMAKYADVRTPFTDWMSRHSFGLYMFHYLGISAVGLYLAKPGLVSAPVAYLLSLIAGFGCGYLFPAIISRIPGYRWAVMGIKKEKKHVS